jgi:Flp pilus assembly protein TadD
MRAGLRIVAAAALAAGLAACQGTGMNLGLGAQQGDATTVTFSTGGAVGAARPKGGDEELRLGKEQFRNANYGLAEKHFRAAVEQSQDSLEALIGLAASYDQLGRFDLADRAYAEALRLGGPTAAFLNNRGYSHYLRRDFKAARADFEAALKRDPGNAMARRNLALVRG